MKFLPGKHLHTEEGITSKIITFQKIRTLVETNLFKKPHVQGALIEKKVDSMIENYKRKPENFQYKNKIIIGIINNEFYILDGQHRVEMICNLCKNDNLYNKKLIVVYYPLNNEKEAQELFNEINIDSYKNQNYISQNHFSQMTINQFRKTLKDNFGHVFSKKKTEKGKIKCIEEFVDELYEIGFLNNKKKEDALNQLITFNTDYYKQTYEKHYEDGSLETLLYKHEHKSIILYKVCFSTKCNNFIHFLKDKVKPLHRWKKNKKRITKGLRQKIWYKYYKHSEVATCPIIHCNRNIYKTKFEAGHIISEYNGGTIKLSNLRPICKTCNLCMGSQNWIDYDNM